MEGFSVLIIDEDAKTREEYGGILRTKGYEVEWAEDGDKGLGLIKERPFDLVLLGESIGGLELLKFIHDIHSEVVNIVISSHPTVEMAVEAMKRGAHHYMKKPLDALEILAIVNKGLEKKRLQLETEELKKKRRIRTIDDLKSLEKIDRIIGGHEYDDSLLIAILQDIQKEMRFLPQESLRFVAHRLNVPLPRVYSLATFYKAFSLKPRGRHQINVCLGTACHVKGGMNILEKLERELGIRAGGTTYDEMFSLEAVRCVGCCGLAPVFVIDEDFHGKVTQDRIPRILREYR